MVRLRRKYERTRSNRASNFNSIMVRLIQRMSCSPTYTKEFQFHNGTIKTLWKAENNTYLYLFQFHNGTIKTVTNIITHLPDLRFQFHNGTIKTSSPSASIAVLLRFQFHNGTIKTLISQIVNFCQSKFQFHNGTIKTLCLQGDWYRRCNFNSIMVRLRPQHIWEVIRYYALL